MLWYTIFYFIKIYIRQICIYKISLLKDHSTQTGIRQIGPWHIGIGKMGWYKTGACQTYQPRKSSTWQIKVQPDDFPVCPGKNMQKKS